MTQNAFAFLKTDHRKVVILLQKLLSTSDRAVKTRSALLKRLKTSLEVHARIEETILYPALEEMDATHDFAARGVEEHNLIKQLLAEVEVMNVLDERWLAKLEILQKMVKAHVKEEEVEMFRQARKIFSPSQIEALGQRLRSAQQQAKSVVESA